MKNKLIRSSLALTSAGVLAFGLTACMGGNEDSVPPSADPSDMNSSEMRLDPLTGNETMLMLDASFTDMLTQMNVSASPIGTATMDADGMIMFPITGGELSYESEEESADDVEGEILHDEAGLSFTDGNSVIEVMNLTVNLEEDELMGDVMVNGETEQEDVTLFELDSADATLMASGDESVMVEGVQLMLSDDLTEVLNDSFANESEGDDSEMMVGTISIDATSMMEDDSTESTDDTMTGEEDQSTEDDSMTETPMPTPSASESTSVE